MTHGRPHRRPPSPRRRWRAYGTKGGAEPVRDFLRALDDDARAQVFAAMHAVLRRGLRAARHLRGDVYEVRARASGVSYRVLFASEGAAGQVLLSLHAFNKKTQKTPPAEIELALDRLADWRRRRRRD